MKPHPPHTSDPMPHTSVEEIYIDFNKTLLAFIKSKVRNSEDAKDILHNVFLKIALNIHTLSSSEKLQNWLYRITRNAIIDYYRSKSGKTSVEIESVLIEDLEDEQNEEVLGVMEKCVKPFINKLPEKYKEILFESEIEGIKQKDLSDKHNLSYPSLRSRVQRGRGKLKDLFLDCCKIEQDSRGGLIGITAKNNCDTDCFEC